MSPVSEFIVRFLVFAALAAAASIGFAVTPLWPLIYITGPVFIPFIAYEYNVMGAQTRFAHHPVAWNLSYVLLVAAASAALSLRKRFGASTLIWVAVVGLTAGITHLVLNALGYYFWMETP